MADDYLALCKNPLSNLPRWLVETQPALTGDKNHQATREARHAVANTGKLHHEILPAMRGGLDADRGGRQDPDRLPPRPQPGLERDDELRSVRADEPAGAGGTLDQVDDSDADGAEMDALRSTYGMRIAAARTTMPKGQDRRAAIKILRDEMKAAMRALTQRMRERRKTRRDAARFRVPAAPRPKPRK